MNPHMSFLIVEKLTTSIYLRKIARAVLNAQDIKENSWRPDKSMLAGGLYVLNDHSAAHQAAENENLKDFWGDVIGEWNYSSWNDVQGWAQEIINGTE